MNFSKRFGFGLSVLKYQISKKRAPLVIGWVLTNRCNLKCIYCDIHRRKNTELNTQKITSLIDEASSMGTKIIGFTGGEALLRKDIKRIIYHSKSKGILVGLSSNGILVPSKIDVVKNVDFLDLSLDGKEDVHDTQRKGRSYRNVLKSAQLGKEYGIKVIFNSTLTKYNLEHVDFIIEKGKELGVKIMFQPVMNLPIKMDNDDIFPNPREFKKTIKRIIEYKKNGSDVIGNSFASLKEMVNWPKRALKKCYAGKLFCRIESDGQLNICDFHENRIDELNCARYGLRKAFNNLQNYQLALQTGCAKCWCSSNLEFNQIFSFNINSIINSLRYV